MKTIKIIWLWLITSICGSLISVSLLKISYSGKSYSDYNFVTPDVTNIMYMFVIFTIMSGLFSIPGMLILSFARKYIYNKYNPTPAKIYLLFIAMLIVSCSMYLFSFSDFYKELCTEYIFHPGSSKLYSQYPYVEYHLKDLLYLIASYAIPFIIGILVFDRMRQTEK